MIRIDEIWLATEPLDMQAGRDKALARVVQVFGSARLHCACLFANKRGNRMKVLIHDGLGIWLCARRLNRGKFHWGEAWRGDQLRLSEEQKAARPKQKPKRTPLPPELPRTLIHHEPDNTQCTCGCQLKRIGEDVREKLDYVPGEFTVERHIRGKWACGKCETLIQAPVPPQVIDKGIPTAGLLAQVLVAKYADHLPQYRHERIFGRAGLTIPRSTLAEWVGTCGLQLQPLVDAVRNTLLEHSVLHADETPVSMLAQGKKKTHKAYDWAYCTTLFSDLRTTVYDFAPSRAGEHARTFLGDWQGKLVCDDYAGYKAGFGNGITEIGCMAHARRKFYDLHEANKCELAAKALEYIGGLYEIERETKDLPPDKCREIRQTRAKPLTGALHQWMLAMRWITASNSGRR